MPKILPKNPQFLFSDLSAKIELCLNRDPPKKPKHPFKRNPPGTQREKVRVDTTREKLIKFRTWWTEIPMLALLQNCRQSVQIIVKYKFNSDYSWRIHFYCFLFSKLRFIIPQLLNFKTSQIINDIQNFQN